MDFDTSNVTPLKTWTKRGKRFVYFFTIAFILLFLGIPAFSWLIDYIWMDTLGFADVFKTILTSKILLVVAGFVVYFLLTYITLFWIRHAYLNYFSKEQIPLFISRRITGHSIIAMISIFFGLLGSSVIQGLGWELVLKVVHATPFGIKDPYFNLDISFYIFILPFIKFIIYTLLTLAFIFLLIEIGFYSVFHMYRMSRFAQAHLGVTILIIGVLIAGIHILGPFETLLTNQVNLFQKSVVHGLSYTDHVINIPKFYVLAGFAIISSIWILLALIRGRIRSMILPVVIYFGVIFLGQAASFVVQNFIVSPNEFAKETPYLEHNLNYTRAAYGINEIREEEHPGNYSLTREMIERNQLTIDNVRLNDARPLLDIYNQLQTFRTYYKFNDMDIDRYKIDGDYEQVFIGARELSTEDLPSQAQTWVNRKLRYTHGYGVAMSHVNKVTSQGQPEYMIKNIPSEGTIEVTRPQIYFGEEPYPNVIVNTKVDEFDYPTGDENVTNRYEAKTGIPLQGINRLLFAINEGSLRMLVSDQLTEESQLLDTRNIMDRVKRIAPFFSYDYDPYIVIRDDGTLTWIIDAYLTAENYPYAEPYRGEVNYIRNSVKVTIDAYTGEVNFYIVDEEDPLIQTYQKMFPTLFTAEVPEDIRSHFRYPEQLFKIQAKMYGTYHMTNLEVFYNREDYWQFPTEKYFNKDIEMEPYYITMKLPEYEEEEFILMTPFTPRNRQNMIAWMGVRNDGDHYGEIFVYRFPKQKNVYGPQQIENRINQDSYISQQLNLWSQGGSEVIRGHLLAIPIEDTVMYVEPVYIESANETSLPEVKQVIIAYEDHIVMEESFEKSLNRILSLIDPDSDTEPDQTETPTPTDPTEPILGAEDMLREIAKQFDQYREALSQGDWQRAGEIMAEIEERLREIEP